MKQNKRRILRTFVTSFTLISWVPLSWSKTAPQTEIHVTLLGQPCLLQGPYDASTLKVIHGIGPAQLYPSLSPSDSKDSRDQAKKALEKIRNTSSLPSLLDRYREKLIKRLEAQIAFFESMDPGFKTYKTGILLKTGKKFLHREQSQFENVLKKIDSPAAAKSSSIRRELIEQAFDVYNDGIEPDPEEDFHRAIKKMNVQYMCSFEEAEDGTGD